MSDIQKQGLPALLTMVHPLNSSPFFSSILRVDRSDYGLRISKLAINRGITRTEREYESEADIKTRKMKTCGRNENNAAELPALQQNKHMQ